MAFPGFDFEGVEFNDSLREVANNRFPQKDIKVSAGDIRNSASLPQKKYDILVCQRVLINLLNPGDQKKALQNLINLMNPQGLLIFIECVQSGLDNLNSARAEFALSQLPPAHHNLYLQDNFFEHPSLNIFDHSKAELFSTHYFVSRVLHQKFLDSTKLEFARNSHFVSFFSQAFPNSVGKYAPLKLLSFIKN